MVLWMCAVAQADTWAAWDDGFVTPPRDDAPTDGVLIYAANYLAPATVVAGPGAPFPLDTTFVTGVGAPPRIGVHPPAGGWVAGASYTVSMGDDDGKQSDVAQLAFTVADGPAPEAEAMRVGAVDVGVWSKRTSYPWGCCAPTRWVTVPVEVDSPDPWAWVELVGEFDLGRPSQITTEPVHQHLDLAMGPGSHDLQLVQWEDEGSPQPPCFTVVPMSAAGVAGRAERQCADTSADPTAASSDGDLPACGCRTGPAGSVWGALGLLMLGVRRARRGPRAAGEQV